MSAARALAAIALLALLSPPLPARAEGCLDCHDKAEIGAGERSRHPPFDEDDCASCHLDHGDEERLVLAESGNDLCRQCHETGEDSFLRAHGGARGDRAACLTCHDPHRSAQEHLLVPNRHRPLAFGRCDPCHRWDGRLAKPVAELCLGCHAGPEFTGRVAHGPLRAGDCLACHDPHAAREPKLLKRRYAAGRWLAGEADVALCLGCHDRLGFFSPGTEGTLFREGGRNYHELHVAAGGGGGSRGEGGRRVSCRNCHETHTSEYPRLVRRELDCGGVPCLRLDYRRSGTGGSCDSGCHAPQSYAFAASAASPPPPRPAPAPLPPADEASRARLPDRSALERSIDRRCVGCHEQAVKRFAAKNVHAPVRSGACSSCHLDHGPENRLVLLGREDRVCAKCHDLRGTRAAAAHGGFPLEGSRCTECHDPHGSDAPGLLYVRRHPPFDEGDCGACHGLPAAGWRVPGGGEEACRGCHDEVGREAFPHSAIAAKGCTGCHRPHVAREAGLLREPRGTLCFRCHPRERFAKETTHPPVQELDCAACHPPHGAASPRLLARPYPLEQFVRFDAAAYALCWECHDEGSIVDPARPADTGFSDGARNLHALHLRDRSSSSELGTRVQPGIACRNCHDPHATEAPRLIRRVLDCNGVPCLQVEFKKVNAGGKCLGGCHVTQSYDPGR